MLAETNLHRSETEIRSEEKRQRARKPKTKRSEILGNSRLCPLNQSNSRKKN